MSERTEKIKRLIRDHTKAATVSRETARASLIADGFYTADGKLKPEYGG